MSRCGNCSYWWQGEDESRPSCHYEKLGSWDVAPCEDDNYEEE